MIIINNKHHLRIDLKLKWQHNIFQQYVSFLSNEYISTTLNVDKKVQIAIKNKYNW